MNKRIFALLIALTILTTAQNLLAIAGNLGGPTQDGSPDHPFLIQDFADFNEFASDPCYWAGSTRLETDVNLATITYTTAIIAPDTNNLTTNFEGTPFTGIFDGNDHTINNLTIDTNGIGNYYLGLFGKISGSAASIINLGMENINIIGGYRSRFNSGLSAYNDHGLISNCYCIGSVSTGEYSYYTGGLCGGNYGVIRNCYSSGSVSSGNHSRYTGGLCGINYFGTISSCHSSSDINGYDITSGLCGENGSTFRQGIINNCYATGNVTGNSSLGGLCGRNSLGTINNCYATGDITGISSCGGFCGHNYSMTGGNSSITNCYATGNVIGPDHPCNFGGFCGLNDRGKITNSYCTGELVPQSLPTFVNGFCGLSENNGTINNCFWDLETAGYWIDVNNFGALGKTTLEMQTKSTFTDADWEFDIWTYNKNGWYMPQNSYPKLAIENANLIKVPDIELMTLSQVQAELTAAGFTIGNIYQVKSWQIPAGSVAGIPASIGGFADKTIPMDIYVSSGSSGNGSLENPYQIASQTDLDAVNNDLSAKYIMTRDIYMNYNAAYTSAVIAPDTNSLSGYQGPAFTGVFDGNDYTINNLTIDLTTQNKNHIGLFGQINAKTAEVKNLGIKKCNITNINVYDAYCIGGLCGYSQYANIINCYVTGSITIGENAEHIGGLCGESRNCNITNCYTTGSITGISWSQYVGGLCGYNITVNINNCYSACKINGGYHSDHMGGLCGYCMGSLTNITNSYATGDVKAADNSYHLGGLCGSMDGSISNCYAAGNVTPNEPHNWIGGLCGVNSYTGTFITKSYFLAPEDSGGPDNGIATPLTSSQMQQQKSFSGWDFENEDANGTSQIWQMPAEGGYPVLSNFNGYTPLTLSGDGSENNPYLVSNAAELGAIYHYNTEACFQLELNIDLNDIQWSAAVFPLFCGCFDGNGHLISNLNINGGSYLGLFGHVRGQNARIQNFGIEDCNIVGFNNFGGLCGYNSYCNINNCYTIGTITGKVYSQYVGGLCGYNDTQGNINNCYAIGSVSAGDQSYAISGLCGGNHANNINNCYASVAVTGKYTNGLCEEIASNSFWDYQVATAFYGGGSPKSTLQMQTLSTFTDAGWDFVGESVNGPNDVWRMCADGVEYPKLWWQFADGDFACSDGVDMVDFAVLADSWNLSAQQQGYNYKCDLFKDDTIDFADLAIFTNHWLEGIE